MNNNIEYYSDKNHKTKISLVIFDLDGTLLNTITDLATSVNYALKEHSLPQRTIEEIKMMIGNGVKKLIYRAVPKDIAREKKEDVLETFLKHYIEHGEDATQPYSGIIEMLTNLRKKR